MPDTERVVVLGQVARDLVLRVGEVPAQGGTTPVTERLEMLGGKGANQAVALAQLGMTVALVGAVGDDEAADRVLSQAAADDIDVSCVARRAGARTALIVSVVNPDGWRYLEDIPDATLAVREDLEAAAALIRRAGTMLIQLQQPPEVTLAAAASRRLPSSGLESRPGVGDLVRSDPGAPGIRRPRRPHRRPAPGQAAVGRGPVLGRPGDHRMRGGRARAALSGQGQAGPGHEADVGSS